MKAEPSPSANLFRLWACLLFSFLIVTACAPKWEDTRLGANWGASTNLAKAKQTLDPNAGKNPEPVVGLDGEAATSSMGNYKKAFEPKAPAPVYQISFPTIGNL